MNAVRTLGRILLPASLVFLAACQTMPGTQTTEATPEAPAETSMQASGQGAPVAVFLADTVNQQGWTPVQIQSGTLYVNPQPVVTRDDLVGVQAGTSQDGNGLLALALNNMGQKKITDITTQNPNKRLALVVGRTMLAAPSFTTPVDTDQLVFAVGTEQNATAAARAIAGVDENGNPIEAPAGEEGGQVGGQAPADSAPAGN
ncbi:SecDF P1 head subdomain-containing protein [Pusillimonas sp.]|uniref:SecDF P1 head subdomain-containing protein n=1 Tax=Pusillimonas sp. TaxID=3040095 RepID=UPI0037C6DB23